MNRANFGNIITNGVQTLSVAGFTGSNWKKGSDKARLADASSALNNMSEDEVRAYGQMQADKMRSEVSRYNAGGQSPYQHLTDEEAGQYQEAVANDMRRKINSGSEDVDDIMGGTPFGGLNSPQAKAIRTYIENNFDFTRNYVRDGRRFRKMTKEDLINSLTRSEDTDADL